MQIEHIVKQPVGQRKPIPLLLLHGAWHGAWCYDLWSDAFASYGYETHTFSLPAHGNSTSDRPVNLLGVGDYVNVLTQVIDSIKPTPYVVAHSMGGYVLQRYLQKHTLPAAVLLCTLPHFGAIPFYLRYFRRHPLRYLAAVLAANLRLMVGNPALVNEYLISDGAAVPVEQLTRRLDQESLRAAIDCMFPIRKPSAKTPLFTIAAGSDSIFTLGEQKSIAEHYNSELLEIPDQGHDLMIERNWEHVALSIRDWLDKQPS